MGQIEYQLGTVGFSYKQWHGVFFPAGMPQRSYLSHYARFFNSVEIDSTFYGTPPAATVERWRQQTPDAFTFALKTPQQITHEKRLHDAEEAMALFVGRARLLAEKLRVILIQLPPDFGLGEKEVLADFLAQLPQGVRYAVEFRNLAWEEKPTAVLLRQHNICWAAADYTIMPKVIHPTADFVYLRLLGRHGRYVTKDQELRDPSADLAHWVNELARWEGAFKQVFAYANNDFAGYSPRTLERLKQQLGLESELPQVAIQQRLL